MCSSLAEGLFAGHKQQEDPYLERLTTAAPGVEGAMIL